MDNVFEKIQDIMADTLELDPSTITMEANLKEDLEADSLDAVEVIMAIEEEFGVEIDDEVIPNIKTVKDLVEYIQNNK